MGLAWCLGEPKRKKPVRGGFSKSGEFPSAIFPLIEEKPGSGGQMGWEVSMATRKSHTQSGPPASPFRK